MQKRTLAAVYGSPLQDAALAVLRVVPVQVADEFPKSHDWSDRKGLSRGERPYTAQSFGVIISEVEADSFCLERWAEPWAER